LSDIITVDPVRRSRLARAFEQVRSYWRGPISSGDKELNKFFNYGGPPASTGINVNEENALSYSAVWAAVSLISSAVANLPLVLFLKSEDGGKRRYEEHPLYRLLHDRPNQEMSSLVMREAMQGHLLTYGKAFAEIERDNANRPVALWPITPDRVSPVRRNGALMFRVMQPGGGEVVIEAANMVHLLGMSFDGINGYGVVDKMRETIGLGLATEQFGGSFFGNGATFGGVFSGKLTPEARKNFVESINARHQGVDRAHRFLLIQEDMTYSKMGVDPDHAQFLETRVFQLDEVARWLNIPPHKLKNLLRSTNNNIEHQNLEYYIDCLSPWANRWEQELEYKLIAKSERNLQSIEHVAEGLLRADTATRGDFHSKQFSTASITPNEIRKVENRNPITGGETAFIQSGFMPLELAGAWWEAEIELKKADAEAKRRPPVAPTMPVDPQKQREIEQLTEERDTARRVAQEAEDAKDIAVQAALTAHSGTEAERAAHEATKDAAAIEILRLAAESEQRLANAREVAATSIVAERDKAALVEARAVYAEAQAATHLSAYEAERAVHEVTRTSTAAEIARLTEQTQGLSLDVVVAQRDTVEVQARADIAIGELRTQVLALTAERDTYQAGLVEAREATAALRVQATDQETARRGIEETLATRTSEASVLQSRLAGVTVATRAAVVDRLAWMTEHESDRARTQQGSPDKLRKWLEQFYANYGEKARAILRPSVKAWAVCVQHPEPVEHLLDVLVAQHIEQSVRQLRQVADENDPESMPHALEKVLRRWEASRAETVADRVLKGAA
jgi:HK97 family phage portal protein